MSEEELNQELSTDELKDVAGGIRVGGNANSKGKNAGKGKRKTSLWGSGDDGFTDKSTPEFDGFTDKSTPQSCTSEGDRSLEDYGILGSSS